MSVSKWRLYCLTDSKWVEGYLDTGVEPTVCFENNTHSINSNSFQKLEEISETTVVIKEETPTAEATAGRFRCDGFMISCPANSTVSKTFNWPYATSALLLRFITEEAHRGDCINTYGRPTTYLGNTSASITSNTNVLPVISTSAFSVGMSLVITDSVNTESLGKITSIDYNALTVTVQNSTENSYYKHAYISYYNPAGIATAAVTAGDYQITCSSTVMQNVTKGMILHINDATNRERLGEVFEIDTVNSKVTIQSSPTNNYAIGSYISISLHMIKNYRITTPTEHIIGAGKIGGSYITKFHVISIDYTNNGNDEKEFCWYTEVLY
jgi:hypothetical protein